MADEESNNQSKSFLLTGACPSKDKINSAIQQLIEMSSLHQRNLIKRICAQIQEDFDSLTKFSKLLYDTFVKSETYDEYAWEQPKHLVQRIKEKYAAQGTALSFEALYNEV